MSQWICCNCCFQSPGPELQLAVTTCGHIICIVCFQKGKPGECLICKTKCQLHRLSDKSSSEVKVLFSDLSEITAKYLSEINKVLHFQTKHQKRLLSHYQQMSENMKETLIKMQQEMQQMSKKIKEKNAYISKLELSLQHQQLVSQSNRDLHSLTNFKPVSSVKHIPFSSPVSLSHHLSGSSLVESEEVESRAFSHKPETSGRISRFCLISPPQDGRIGTVPHRAVSQGTMGSQSVRSATVSREFCGSLKEPKMSSSSSALYRRDTPWEASMFNLTYKFPSTSSLGPLP
ncbi:probable E3 SUMO-protein ligase RNF212 isoform X2 [Hoplias malabaricus]|uniref:probable E3 SUMO-protein ligase RNF212 isoform X2 n=1 Tax=Hoplias malabaricus TaxID=27720 RepID=UPI0034635B6E